MADAGEFENPTVEKAVEEVPATEEKPVEEKPRAAKDKKPRAPKTISHPPYFQMIKEALLSLNGESGSSPYAIAKFMEEKHKAVLPANFRKMLVLQLKNSAAKGKLIKIKASYKLSEPGKATGKAKAAAKKKPKQAKATAPKTDPPKARRSKRRSETEKKQPVSKKAKKPAPAKAKQPKSIKSPVAKKTKKAAA